MSPTFNPRYSTPIQISFIVCAVLFLLLRAVDSFWGVSGDVAHHYALTARIMDLFGVPGKYDPSLGEMNIYPAGSHIMAAILGYLLHSPFLGMHLISVLSVILIWGAIFFMLLSLPRKSAMLAAVGLLVLITLNRVFKHELFGHEIITNYFYAQLVGQAVAMAVIALQMHLERKSVKPVLRHISMLLLIYGCISVHLLPAIELLGFFCICLCADLLADWRTARPQAIKKALFGFCFVVLTTVLLLKHPYYLAMKEIGANNGELSLRYLRTVHLLAIFSIIVTGISFYLLMQWMRQDRLKNQFIVYKYFACFGLAIGLLCLLQYALLSIGSGSEYAVKKYAYALNTVFFIELILLTEFYCRKRLTKFFTEYYARNVYHFLLLPAIGILLAVSQILSHANAMDVSSIVKSEAQILVLRDTLLTTKKGKANYVSGLKPLPSMINYMFSIGLLEAPRSKIAIDILMGRPMQDFQLVNTVITSEDSLLDKTFACRLGDSVGGLVRLDGQCAEKFSGKNERIYYFSGSGEVENCQISGFGGGEELGRWTNTKNATISCIIPKINQKDSKLLVISSTAFITDKLQQRLLLSVNSGKPQEYLFNQKTPLMEIQIPLENLNKDKIDLVMEMPDAISPSVTGIGNDDRTLGVYIKKITFK